MKLVFAYVLMLVMFGALWSTAVDIDWRSAVIFWKDRIIDLAEPSQLPEEENLSPGDREKSELLSIAKTVSPSVVSVFGDLPGSNKQIAGSGFFISPAGLVVTSRHVVDHAKADYVIVTASGHQYKVTKILKSATSDVALLRTKARSTPWLTLDIEDAAYPGQTVMTVGAGKGRKVSFGSVVTVNNIVTAYGSAFTEEVAQWDAMHINAIIRPGDSGGPLLNDDGEVIGVVFAFDAGTQAAGFALPLETVKHLVKQLLDQEYRLKTSHLLNRYQFTYS